jgi:hypothetical protein
VREALGAEGRRAVGGDADAGDLAVANALCILGVGVVGMERKRPTGRGGEGCCGPAWVVIPHTHLHDGVGGYVVTDRGLDRGLDRA